MTVKELIEALQELNPDLPVINDNECELIFIGPSTTIYSEPVALMEFEEPTPEADNDKYP